MGETREEITITSEDFANDNPELEGILTSLRRYQLKQEISDSEGIYNKKYLKEIARIVNAAYGDVSADRIVVVENTEADEILIVKIIQGV